MANIKSQIKRIRTSDKARLRNKAAKSTLKTHITKLKAAVTAGDKDGSREALVKAIKGLDGAAAKGFIHGNNAANKKSSLTKLYNKLS